MEAGVEAGVEACVEACIEACVGACVPTGSVSKIASLQLRRAASSVSTSSSCAVEGGQDSHIHSCIHSYMHTFTHIHTHAG